MVQMPLSDAIRIRRSVRGFEPDREVPRDTLREVLEIAQLSPSNCNVQPWRLWIASGERRTALSRALCAAFDSGNMGDPEDPIDTFPPPYRRLQVECGATLYGSMGVARDDMNARMLALRRNFEFFDAPHLAVLCMDKHFGVGVALDVGTWLQSFLTLLAARGIGSCAQAALRQYPTIVREQLEIPDNQRVLCGVAFGYEDAEVDANSTRQTREPLETNVVFVD